MDLFGWGVLVYMAVSLLHDRVTAEHIRLLRSRVALLEGKPLCGVCQSVLPAEEADCDYCHGVPSWRHGVFHKGLLF